MLSSYLQLLWVTTSGAVQAGVLLSKQTLPKALRTQLFWFGLVGFVWKLWFSKLGWLSLVWFGRFGLAGLAW